MRKRMLSLLCVLALCLGLLPVTALAAENAPTTLYVGGQSLPVGQDSYWITDANTGKLTEYTTGGDEWTVKYEYSSVTLTLKNATIKGVSNDVNIVGAGIYAASSSGPVSLNIVLVGENEVTGGYGINVSSGEAASLSITGSGSLTVSATAANGIGIFVQAQSDANLTIDGANVNAVVTETNGRGVELSTGQAGNPNLTIEFKGGSLQASGQPNGIKFFTNANNTRAYANLKVSGNAMVKTSGITTDADGSGSQGAVLTTEAGSGETGGIVFDGSAGTVYGTVELQNDLTISEGETLTIGDGASLNTGSHEVIVNGGTLTGGDKIEGTVKYAPAITTESLPGGTVGEPYTETILAATGDASITWSVSNGSLPAGLSLSEDGKITGTPTTAGTSTFTVKAENNAGSDSEEYTINIAAKSDTTPPTLTAGTVNRTSDTEATVTFTSDEAGTYFYKVVDSGAGKPTDITSGTSYSLTSDTNTITLADLTAGAKDIYIVAKDNSNNESTVLTMGIPAYVEPVYSISANTTLLDFSSVYTGYIQPAAKTVTITNTGNQPLTLTQPGSTSSFDVGTLSTTSLPVNGTATFTVQPKAGLAVGTYSENITVSGDGGATVTITANFTVKQYSSGGGTPTKTPSQQAVDKIESAKDGSTVEIKLSTGSTKLDKEVFEELAGRDVTLEISLSNGVTWTVNGQDIPENADLTDLDLGVTLDASTIPVSVVNTITGAVDTIQISLKHDGEFGFTMTLSAPLGKTNADY